MAKTTVLVVGASGETGKSIVNGLLEAGQFEIIALIRPGSVNKSSTSSVKAKGVEIRIGDVGDSVETLTPLLKGVDTVISAVGPAAQLQQLALVDAAKLAGVKRFVPCAFITVAPPGGIMALRDQKEAVYNHIKKLYLPYTIIDVGYWYQLSYPTLPSGKVDYAVFRSPDVTIYGNGEVKTAITDLRDIGPYVAKVISDKRTLNKYVFCYGEVLSQRQVFGIMEGVSGEKIEPTYVAAEDIANKIEKSKESVKEDPTNFTTLIQLVSTEYVYSKFIRGDNTPEYAKYLGYLDARDLYPDFKPRGFVEFLNEVLEGKAEKPYAGVSF